MKAAQNEAGWSERKISTGRITRRKHNGETKLAEKNY